VNTATREITTFPKLYRYRHPSCILRKSFISLVLLFLIVSSILAADPGSKTESKLDRQTLRKLSLLPESEAFEQWLHESGETFPDFDRFPSLADIPDPLIPLGNPDADAIQTLANWEPQRIAIQQVLQQWMLGSTPPPPDSITVIRLQGQMEWNATSHHIQLQFGQDATQQAMLNVELFIPNGDGPFPVFLTQSNHRSWARIAMQRGYLGVVYAAADIEDNSETFVTVYPDHDWSLLMRRAWAASRVVDFLESYKYADNDRIAIVGHSRNGKQSLIAAAFDDRIDAVISSSSGAGGVMPWRISSEYEYAESIESMTRVFPEWFHPRLRFFAGREDRLPFDMTHQLALIAPRPCLISTAINDGVEQTWAIQRAMQVTAPVWTLYGSGANLGVQWRPGGHETHPEIIHRYVDWLDDVLNGNIESNTDEPLHPIDWDAWAELSSFEPLDEVQPDLMRMRNGRKIKHKDQWLTKRWEIKEDIRHTLGVHPPGAEGDRIDYGSDPSHVNRLLERQNNDGSVRKIDFVFGDYISGDLYYAPSVLTVVGDLPAILWLHPANRPKGFTSGFKLDEQFYKRLAKEGFAVFCFDMIGYGRRVDEDGNFYDRFPDWSLLGKMVWDARSAIDRFSTLPRVDKDRIYIAGYGLGAWIALHAAALDYRHAGIVAVAPPGPLTSSKKSMGKDYLHQFSIVDMLNPQLGIYRQTENPPPYDLQHLLAASAPKPLLMVQPRGNWRVDHPSQMESFKQAERIYNLYAAEEELDILQPNRNVSLDPELQSQIIDWLNRQIYPEDEK
jgi:pimeloyl-ACP methyl ester carboxylesterase